MVIFYKKYTQTEHFSRPTPVSASSIQASASELKSFITGLSISGISIGGTCHEAGILVLKRSAPRETSRVACVFHCLSLVSCRLSLVARITIGANNRKNDGFIRMIQSPSHAILWNSQIELRRVLPLRCSAAGPTVRVGVCVAPLQGGGSRHLKQKL